MICTIPVRQVQIKAFSLKLPKGVTIDFLSTVQKWVENSGIEWSVERLKSLKQDLIHYYNSNELPQTPWVKRSKTGMFSGCIGVIFNYAKQSNKCFVKSLSLLNIYTSFISEDITEKQRTKFIAAVTTASDPVPQKYIQLCKRAASLLKEYPITEPMPSIELIPTLAEKREKRLVAEINDFCSSTIGRDIMIKYPLFYGPLKHCISSRRRYSKDENPVIGNVHCTQNPGLKARFFASPDLWLQYILKPLGDVIYEKVKTLPWDATFDQLKPDSIVHSHLREGKEIFCFDLSSATDRFPFKLQIEVLRSMFSHVSNIQFIDFYEEIQSLPYNFYGEKIRWNVGQALGMYPSFGTFTLTHGVLLYALNDFQHSDKFYVLGDDVIILDSELALKYRTFLDECKIPYAPEKTIQSNSFAEFAGNLYFSDFKYRIPKWKPLNKKNILDQIEQWGTDIIQLLPKQYHNLLTRVSSLPKPYGPEKNPCGLSLDQRFNGFEDILLEKDDEELEYSTKFREIVMNRFITNLSVLRSLADLPKSLREAAQLEQSCVELIHDRIGINIPPAIMGRNLYSVDTECGLPLVTLMDKSSSTFWSKSFSRYFNLWETISDQKLK